MDLILCLLQISHDMRCAPAINVSKNVLFGVLSFLMKERRIHILDSQRTQHDIFSFTFYSVKYSLLVYSIHPDGFAGDWCLSHFHSIFQKVYSFY